jgi:hypothetical protein
VLSGSVGCSALVGRRLRDCAFPGRIRQRRRDSDVLAYLVHRLPICRSHILLAPTKLLVIVALITPPLVLENAFLRPPPTCYTYDCAQRPNPLGAMAAAFQHLKVTQLSSKEKEAALQCGRFLSTAPFKAQDDYEVCSDNTGLGTSSQAFIDSFAPGTKVYTHI